LLPSHARANVVVGDRTIVVETTTVGGFDPPEELERQVIDRARPQRGADQVDLYADEKGTEVTFSALLAATYGNLSIWSQERGENALASALVEREALLTPPDVRPLVRMQQMALLTELATRHLREGNLNEAMRFGRQAYDASPDEKTRGLAE